jgi:alpha-N-arabinofuranosidase
MEVFLKRDCAILDFHDPQRRIGLIVDEWGAWYAAEPGTNPGFLYQQNSLRDALVAGMTLNLFNNHAHRVHMANLAQTINVLQSVLLTEGDKMVKTPTYHVFDLYKVHQDATLLPTTLRTADYTVEDRTLPALNVSASRDKEGVVHISVCNLHATRPQPLAIRLGGERTKGVTGRTLTADTINAHNTFTAPETVAIQDFPDATWDNGTVSVELPARSVTLLRITTEG